MKRISMTTLLLTFFVALNLLLIYFLLFDTQFMTSLFNRFEEETVITSTSEPVENVNAFHQRTDPAVEDIIAPYKLIVHEADKLYDVNYHATLEEVVTILGNQSIELVDNHVETDPELFQAVFQQDFVQLIYLTKFSVPTLRRLIEIPTDLSTQFELNRIVMPKSDPSTVYLVDTLNETYIKARMQHDDIKDDVFALVNSVRNEQWLPVERYQLYENVVYLPIHETLSSSQVYTLDELPDSLFLTEVFPNNNYDISEPDENNIRSYHTLLTSLLINDTTNVMTVSHTFPAVNSSNSMTRDMILAEEKMRYSFPYIQSFEYWRGDIHLFDESNNVVTYRRFLNGLPIYSAQGIADYGATKVTLRTNTAIEVYRYQMPLVILGTHIHDLSQVHDIESADQITAILTEQGLDFSDFTNITLGYEWQADMEDFRKAILIPKWFFHINSNHYSIDQVLDGTVRTYVDQQANSGVMESDDLDKVKLLANVAQVRPRTGKEESDDGF